MTDNRGMGAQVRIIDYGAFPQPPQALFLDYVAGSGKVGGLFADQGRWDLSAIDAAAARTLQYARPREELTRALVAQQEARKAARAAEVARQLAQPGAVALVTGQQPVLFGGPLFVIYKALATLQIAEALARHRRAPVVPIFWIAADDHDFAEIESRGVDPDQGARLVRLLTDDLNRPREIAARGRNCHGSGHRP